MQKKRKKQKARKLKIINVKRPKNIQLLINKVLKEDTEERVKLSKRNS